METETKPKIVGLKDVLARLQAMIDAEPEGSDDRETLWAIHDLVVETAHLHPEVIDLDNAEVIVYERIDP